MVKSAPPRTVRRVEVVSDVRDTESHRDYRDGFEVTPSPTDSRSAEEWARSAFEEAPWAVRSFLLVGWRCGLGLRLGPRPSPDHVLGCRIVSNQPDAICFELRSSLLTSRLVLHVTDAAVTLSTHIDYAGSTARILWAAVGPIHRRVLPSLLGRAAAAPTETG